MPFTWNDDRFHGLLNQFQLSNEDRHVLRLCDHIVTVQNQSMKSIHVTRSDPSTGFFCESMTNIRYHSFMFLGTATYVSHPAHGIYRLAADNTHSARLEFLLTVLLALESDSLLYPRLSSALRFKSHQDLTSVCNTRKVRTSSNKQGLRNTK